MQRFGKSTRWISLALCVAGLGLSACTRDAPPITVTLPDVARPGSAEPNLAAGRQGTVVMSWLEPEGENTSLRYARLIDESWTPPQTVQRGNNWFVNWADFPSVVPLHDDLWAAHWLAKSADLTYAYDVLIATSRDGGQTWSEPLSPHTDGTPTEHGFVSLFHWDGHVGAVWLDGRNTVNEFDASNVKASGMTLRAAALSGDGSRSRETVIDDLVCDCCQTDVATTARGVTVVYRDRTADEIRDIYIARHREGNWQAGIPVANDDWNISGCPVNGPAIAALDEHLSVAWFTGQGNEPRIRVAFSNDDGQTFSTVEDIDVGSTLGRVDLLPLEDGSVVLGSLRDGGDGTAKVELRRVAPDAGPKRPLLVGTTAAGRLSGFPRLARHEQWVVVAWTDADDTGTRVRSALVAISAL